MSFDWLGTFNKSQFDRFAAFARSQVASVDQRVLHLTYEKNRIGSLSFKFDNGGYPVSYTVSDTQNTYIGKLVAAYEVLGGNVIRDLQVRTLAQAVYIMRGTETTPAQFLSNGEVMGQKGLGDAESAELVRAARAWMQGPLYYKREYLERKVRRAIDYADQLDAEITLLQTITKDATVDGSLENSITSVEKIIGDITQRVNYDDKGKDPDGKASYAPLLPYSRYQADPQKVTITVGVAGRDQGGYRPPGV